ncbi:hypothetical protein [Streptomyces viridochromogenes]|jgi:hypothetical protein|uniref:hypothetical protein n=1 Tax=Streptomyces viridochromogenes TaxID=1938 RepID=UPI00069D12AC|nr:hypothetical protein [Streptomyces viridochromogenes]KOG21808.1 hypothetical protein ADK36_12600 [Streptomyces viridochromogenes]
MTELKQWRLTVGGQDYTDDCDDIDVQMPALVYDVPHDDGRAQRRHLGPKGFSITLTQPSERLRSLADGGHHIRIVKVAFEDQAIRVPVVFHEEWVDRDGVRKMFGSLYVDPDREPKWVTEPTDGGRRPLTLVTKEG